MSLDVGSRAVVEGPAGDGARERVADASRGVEGLPSGLLAGYVGALVMQALDELGVLDAVFAAGTLPVHALAEGTDTHPGRLRALLRVACLLGYLEFVAGTVALTDAGRAARWEAGHLRVITRGFAPLFGRLATLAACDPVPSAFEGLRDDAEVARGCARIHRTRQAPILERVLSGINYRGVLDVGCGDASRLIELVVRVPGARGVGIDISPDACELARENIARHGLRGQVSVVEGDALELLASPPRQLREQRVDLVISFFLMHHIFDAPGGAGGVLASLRDALPGLRYLVIGDHLRLPEDPGPGEMPAFSLGFELFHALIGVELRARAEYERAFAQAGLDLLDVVEFGHPQEYLFLAAGRTAGRSRRTPGSGRETQGAIA